MSIFRGDCDHSSGCVPGSLRVSVPSVEAPVSEPGDACGQGGPRDRMLGGGADIRSRRRGVSSRSMEQTPGLCSYVGTFPISFRLEPTSAGAQEGQEVGRRVSDHFLPKYRSAWCSSEVQGVCLFAHSLLRVLVMARPALVPRGTQRDQTGSPGQGPHLVLHRMSGQCPTNTMG